MPAIADTLITLHVLDEGLPRTVERDATNDVWSKKRRDVEHEGGSRPMRMADLKPGWAVLGNDGRRLGAVQGAGQDYLLVSRGVFSGQLYVPASAIANVEHEVVHLNIPKSQAEQMSWEQPPREPDEPDSAPDSDPLHRHV